VKTIGILGGLAWLSSAIYYRTINELVARRLGGLHCARLVLAQTDFEQVERYQREGRWDLVGDLLASQAGKPKAAGADFFLLACRPGTARYRSSTRPSPTPRPPSRWHWPANLCRPASTLTRLN